MPRQVADTARRLTVQSLSGRTAGARRAAGGCARPLIDSRLAANDKTRSSVPSIQLTHRAATAAEAAAAGQRRRFPLAAIIDRLRERSRELEN